MDKKLVLEVTIKINASIAKVWDAFINPETIKKYMFGTNVISDWTEGSQILWRGEWEGRSYEDKGKIIRFIPQKILQYSYYSSMSGMPDIPENYHNITIELQDKHNSAIVTLKQINISTEQAKAHSEKNWEMLLLSLKRLLEN